MRVGAEFYRGPGRELLCGYRMRLAIPVLPEAVAALWLIVHGNWWGAMLSQLAGAVLGGRYRVAVAKRYACEARRNAAAGEKPVTARSVSLRPRSPADYPVGWLE